MFNKRMRNSQQQSASCRGLTLTELVIVLAIMGVVLGAIFAALPSVYRKHQIEVAVNEVWQIAGNVRNLYTGRKNIDYGAIDEATQIAAGLFPEDMLRDGSPITPWGSGVKLYLRSTNPTTFDIDLNVADEDNGRCVQILSIFSKMATGDTLNDPNQLGAPLDVLYSTEATAGTFNSVRDKVGGEIAATIGNNQCMRVRFHFAI